MYYNNRINNKGDNAAASCSYVGCLALINVLAGGFAVDAILSWFGKDIPFLFDWIIGLFSGQLVIPVAIIGSILKAFNVF